MDNEIPQDAAAGGGEGGEGSSSKQKEEKKPATFRELGIRLGAVGNFGVQALNVVLASTTKGPWGSLDTTGKVGRGMVYGSSGLGAAHSRKSALVLFHCMNSCNEVSAI